MERTNDRNRHDLCEVILEEGKRRGLSFSVTKSDFLTTLKTETPISRSAYLGARKRRKQSVTINLVHGHVGIVLTAKDLVVMEDPSGYCDLETMEEYLVNDERTSLAVLLTQEDVWSDGPELIFDKIRSLEFLVEYNIRRNLMRKNQEAYRKKQREMIEGGQVVLDEKLLCRLQAVVEEDRDRRLKKCMNQFKSTGFPRERLDEFKRMYYSDIGLDFVIEKDPEVSLDKYREIQFDYGKTGNPVPAMEVPPYAVDGYTLGQWLYIFYYACKGETWIDYETYFRIHDQREEHILGLSYALCQCNPMKKR